MAAQSLDEPDKTLRQVISNLYMLMVQTHDYQGPSTHHAMTDEFKKLLQNLVSLAKVVQTSTTMVPVDLIEFVENARNPDIYTRQFVEEAMRINQELKGKTQAFTTFSTILGQQMTGAIPDIQDDVRQILKTNGIELS